MISFRVIALGLITLVASLSSRALPTIDTDSRRVFCDPLAPPTLTVSADGDGISYQWYRGQPGDTSAVVPGATSADYTPPASTDSLEIFWVRLTHADGSIDSPAYTVTRTGRAIAAGGAHSLFLKVDGSTWFAGTRFPYPHPLHPDTFHRPLPTPPIELASDVVAISAGGQHDVVLKSDGSAWLLDRARYWFSPRQVLTGVVAISAGGDHSLFLKADGSAWQIRAEFEPSTPTPIQIMTGVAAISAGGNHSLLLKTDGTAWAFGGNSHGQLGDGSDEYFRASPVEVMTGVAAVSAGGTHSLFLKTDGSVWLAGRTVLGYGHLPYLILEDAAAIEAGEIHSLILKSDGSVWTEGDNSRGQLGNGSTLSSAPPSQLTTEGVAISAGGAHSLVYKRDGTILAVGDNSGGQLADPTTGNRYAPVSVMDQVTAVSAGAEHSLFLKSDGSAWAVGDNSHGQLGNGSYEQTATPVQVLSEVVALSAGGSHSLFLKTDDTVWAVGNAAYGQLGSGSQESQTTPVQVMAGVSAISAGYLHSLFLKTDGTAWAVGDNSDGRLGDGTTTDRLSPVLVMSDVAAISAGTGHSLFLKTDGSVWACGFNQKGELGTGSTEASATPVQILTGVAAISAGSGYSLFIKTDGSLWACGDNAFGQISAFGVTDYMTTPILVLSSISPLSAIDAGNDHSLFRSGNFLAGMGSNSTGQLGQNSLGNMRRPSAIFSEGLVTHMSAGGSHSLLIDSENRAWSLGGNQHGQLGLGFTNYRTLAVTVFDTAERATQTVTLSQPPDRLSNEGGFALTASASSGLPVYLEVLSGPAYGSSELTVVPTGIGTVFIRAVQPGNPAYQRAISAEYSFEIHPAWPADTQNDPDADGLPNLLEYALGTDTAVANPTPVSVARDGLYLSLTFPMVPDPALTFLVQGTNELTGPWEDIWSSSGGSNTTEVVTVNDYVELSADVPRRFLRLQINTP